MALSTATITFDLADWFGADLDVDRARAWITTNAPDGYVVDTAANKIRVDDALVTIGSDGTGTVTVWVPGAGANPATWQTTFHFDVYRPGRRDRTTLPIGPFTITTSGDLADLIEEQVAIPTATASDYADAADASADAAAASAAAAAASETAAETAQAAAEAAAALAEDISNIDTADEVVEQLVAGTGGAGPLTRAALSASFGGWRHVTAYGATGDGATDDTAAIQAALDDQGAVIFPPGDYKVTDTLLVTAETNVVILPGARVFAGSAIGGAIFRTTDAFVRTVAFTGGGVVDCADLADIGIHLYRFAHVRVQDLRIDSALVYGIKVGDAATVRSAEAVIRGVHILRLSGSIPASNNYGIYCENSGDHSFSQIIVQSYRVGVKMTSGTSSLDDVHCWHDPALGSFDRAFEDDGNGNVYTNCYADTPETYGWHLSGFNTRIDNSTVYINPTNGINDNVLVGVQFTQPSPFATISNTAFFGGSVTKRIATDISVSGGDLTTVDVWGCVRSQVVNANSLARTRLAYIRDLTLSDKGTIPSASSGLRGQVNLVRGASGVADTAAVCLKRADGTYAWEPVAVPGSATERLTSGEATIRRTLATAATLSTGSGQLRLTYFTASRTETVTQIRMYSGSTAAGATPTLVRVGIYSVAENGDLTLVASTANDTSLLASANTAYTKALAESWAKVAGQRYALGLLVVTAAAAPTMVGQGISSGLPAAELAASPKLCALLSGQTDLPASVTDASVFSTTQMYYAALLP